MAALVAILLVFASCVGVILNTERQMERDAQARERLWNGPEI